MGIEMKGCDNLENFFKKIEALKKEMGKAGNLLFNEINKDLSSSWDHIRA